MDEQNKPIRKTDRRTLYTRQVIKDALLEAMHKKPFERITVTEICRLAEITRATYYLHYQSLTDVLDDALDDALHIAENETADETESLLELSHRLASIPADHLQESDSLMPVCQRAASLPKYKVLFLDETISGYVVNRIYQSQKQRFIHSFSQQFHLSEKESQLLALFIINGSFSVNKALHWQKDNTWYQIQALLLRFISSGYDGILPADAPTP